MSYQCARRCVCLLDVHSLKAARRSRRAACLSSDYKMVPGLPVAADLTRILMSAILVLSMSCQTFVTTCHCTLRQMIMLRCCQRMRLLQLPRTSRSSRHQASVVVSVGEVVCQYPRRCSLSLSRNRRRRPWAQSAARSQVTLARPVALKCTAERASACPRFPMATLALRLGPLARTLATVLADLRSDHPLWRMAPHCTALGTCRPSGYLHNLV